MANNKVQLADGSVLIDLTDTTATAADVAQGKYFYTADGVRTAGTASGGSGGSVYQDQDGYIVISEDGEGSGGAIGITDTIDSHGGTIREITAVSLANDTVTPATLGLGVTAHDRTGTAIVGTADIPPVEPDPLDVDFVDYDGTLLYTYTASDFLNLTSLPANPSHPGLVAQGWNWTLADAQEFVAEYGAQVIGQNYITDDGKTRIYITIPKAFAGLPDSISKLYLIQIDSPTFIIDWGDGATTSSFSGYYASHSYQGFGDYVITITVTSGSLRLGYPGANNTLVSSDQRANLCVTKIEIGSGVIGFGRNFCGGMHNLKSVSIPVTCNNHDTGTDNGWFYGACLTGIVLPAGTPGQDSSIACGNTGLINLRYISIPKTMNGFRWNATYSRKLRKLILPNYTTNTTLQTYLYDVPSLTHFIVPGSYTTITTDRCRQSLIRKLTIPETVTSIAATAFRYNYYLEEIHLLPTTPPTLANASAFNEAGSKTTNGCIFYVPYSEDHSILAAYQSATNWSTYASQMQEEAI